MTNAVLALHGTTGTGRNFLSPSLAGALFGPGQPLDAEKYYIIMPDGIGRGGSSKPSDGLRMKFPHYGYVDLVEAQHALVVDGLHIDHLRLVLGTSMGGMHAWLWGERYPQMMDAIMPVASQPVAVTGRNYLWRDLIIQSIRTDPDWQNGDYVKEPAHFVTALPIFTIMTGSPRVLEAAAPTQAKANAYFDKLVGDARTSVDANDYLYWFEAVKDYDPEPALDKIVAPLVRGELRRRPAQSGATRRHAARHAPREERPLRDHTRRPRHDRPPDAHAGEGLGPLSCPAHEYALNLNAASAGSEGNDIAPHGIGRGRVVTFAAHPLIRSVLPIDLG